MSAVLAGLACASALLMLLGGPTGRLHRALAGPGSGARQRPGLLAGLLGRVSRSRQEARLRAQLPACLELMASCLDAGLPPAAALAEVADLVEAPSSELLSDIAARIALGATDEQAWSEQSGHRVWGEVARDLARCAESGSAAAHLLRAHATETRRAQLATREQWARAVGVRSVLPLVCCQLPAFILVGVIPILAGVLDKVLP